MTVVNDVKLKPKDGVFVPCFQKKKKKKGGKGVIITYEYTGGVSGLHLSSKYLPDPVGLQLQICNFEVNEFSSDRSRRGGGKPAVSICICATGTKRQYSASVSHYKHH